VTVLSTETLLDTEDIAQAGETGLQVELGALGEEGWLAVVIELEECRTAFDLCLNEAGRRDFDEVVGSKGITERREHMRAETQDARCGLATEDEVAEIGLDRRVGFLREFEIALSRVKLGAHLVQSVGEGVFCTRRSSDNSPVVNNKFVSSRSSLALRDFLERSDELDRRL